MERFNGWSASRLIGNHSRSAANQKMRHHKQFPLIYAIGMEITATSRIKQVDD